MFSFFVLFALICPSGSEFFFNMHNICRLWRTRRVTCIRKITSLSLFEGEHGEGGEGGGSSSADTRAGGEEEALLGWRRKGRMTYADTVKQNQSKMSNDDPLSVPVIGGWSLWAALPQ